MFEAYPLFVPVTDWSSLFSTMASDDLLVARMDAVWSWVEPDAPVNGQQAFTWSRAGDSLHSLDSIVGALAATGIRMEATLEAPPTWTAGPGTELAPAYYGDFEAFAAALAARYGAGGTFWAQNPQLPYLPIQQFEVWDEANSNNFWTGTPDAATYMSVLVPLSAAVHAVDPSAEVLASIGWPQAGSYVSQLYSLGVKGSIQGIALHPYAPDAPSIVTLAQAVRSALDSSGDPSLPIYVTEIGLPAATAGSGADFAYDGPVNDAARAATLSLAGDALAHSDCNVQSYDVFSLVSSDDNTLGGGGSFGMFDAATDAPDATASAIGAASQRWQSAPAGGLVLCGTGTTATRALLPLAIQLTHTSPTCVSAYVTYEGNPLEGAELVLSTLDGRVDPAGTNAFGETQMCLQNGPPITSFSVYAEISSPNATTTASLTSPNMARSATYSCPITSAACALTTPPPSLGAAPSDAAGGYRLAVKIVRIRDRRVTLRARLVHVGSAASLARVWLRLRLQGHGKHALKLIGKVRLTVGRWRTLNARANVRVGDHVLATVSADKAAGLIALHSSLLATHHLGAR